ncbi:MAG: glycosyl hydrolase 53 family protein [Bacilli bacterium]
MNKILKKLNGFLFLPALLLAMNSCGSNYEDSYTWPTDGSVKFNYDTRELTNNYGDKSNVESYDYDNLLVKTPTNALREDFAYGVDASMVYSIYQNGGIYYNEDGKEQNIFEIMHNDGVNFIRFRVWNDPYDANGNSYGGGENSVANDLIMAKQAKEAKLNVMLDFHYSDFWADPDTQYIPKAWQDYGSTDLENAIGTFTSETLQTFKDAGVTVDAVQIGNEINNGLLFPYGKLNTSSSTSWDKMARLLSQGIDATKSVFPHCYTVIHLAEGGQKQTFETFFTEMDKRELDYDIIGASYYPYWHGTLDNLQTNLNNVTAITGKPVMIMETAWGFTTEQNDNCSNIYDSTLEEAGGYLTSVQAQATCISDICDVLSQVPNNMGLGIFYWDADWIPTTNAGWATKQGQSYNDYGDDDHASLYSDGLSSWSNQALFSYTGKALPSLATYKYIKEGGHSEEEVGKDVKSDTVEIILNLGNNETLPTTYQVITNYDALREYEIVWDEEEVKQLDRAGKYVVHGVVNGVSVTANVTCELNYANDPSYENQTSTTLGSPWNVISGSENIKVDLKSNGRTGTNDLNYYHSGSSYGFEVSQTITNVNKGTYNLRTYVEGTANTNSLIVYCKYGDETKTFDLSDKLNGWSADKSVAFKEAKITDIIIPTDGYEVTIGVIVAGAESESWGHIDDWSFAEQF